MRETTHHIYFSLGGKDFAFRTWHSVPRVGEHVMFNTGEPEIFRVVRVVWNTAPMDDHVDMPTINVTLEHEE